MFSIYPPQYWIVCCLNNMKIVALSDTKMVYPSSKSTVPFVVYMGIGWLVFIVVFTWQKCFHHMSCTFVICTTPLLCYHVYCISTPLTHRHTSLFHLCIYKLFICYIPPCFFCYDYYLRKDVASGNKKVVPKQNFNCF